VDFLLDNEVTRTINKVGKRWSPVLEYSILFLICVMSFFIRLFAVIRFESVIHEFDPYFNFRTTRFLSREGYYEFWNWFDEGSWYPLGRVIGQTLYPGLMTTSYLIFHALHFFGIMIDIKDVCVFLAPLFSGCAAMASYLFTKEVTGRSEAGLLGAVFLGIAPSYLSRSVAGSYDNEGVAIFALVFSFYVFVKAIHTGTMLWGMLAALAYFYMVSAWGGYVFITNTVSIYMVAMTLLGRVTGRHFVVFCTWYIIGTMLCLNIPFVNFQAVTSSEHMASHGVFLMLLAYMASQYLRDLIPREGIKFLVRVLVVGVVGAFLLLFSYLTITGKSRWSGRSMTLLDPTYASKYIPIIASVSEHQPTTWSAYILDLHILILLAPIGLLVCFKHMTDGMVFAGLYGILSVYFSGVMIRLMLVLAPAAAVLAAIGLSWLLSAFVTYAKSPTALQKAKLKAKGSRAGASLSSFMSFGEAPTGNMSRTLALLGLGFLLYCTVKYVAHCTWTSSVAYSHPSIVLAHRGRDGARHIQDDFREAYYWLRQNTYPRSRIMSWWDYGYQITTMGNRTVLVDNNTWNNTHIATVGLAWASKEEDAYPILLKHDVDYVLVVFGGVARYQSDDINKFLWMIRIASGVYPRVQEADFMSPTTRGYSVGKDASQTMINSLMYKCCYYRFAEISRGFDYARNSEIGKKDVTFKHLEEAFTSQNWIVRIYKVLKPPNRGTKLKSRSSD